MCIPSYAGTTVSVEQYELIVMSSEKMKCDEFGGKILLFLGVLNEPVSHSESASSDEANLEEMV
jgi:hypothetical protein